jgi:hypothetical protein
MKTHTIDLNAILERERKEYFQIGYNAALQEVGRFINTNLGKSLAGFSPPGRSLGKRRRLMEGSLTALVLSKIEAHPDGVFALEIKDWLRSGESPYATHPNADKRVDTALTRLKSYYGAIVKKDNGKWYAAAEPAAALEKAGE